MIQEKLSHLKSTALPPTNKKSFPQFPFFSSSNPSTFVKWAKKKKKKIFRYFLSCRFFFPLFFLSLPPPPPNEKHRSGHPGYLSLLQSPADLFFFYLFFVLNFNFGVCLLLLPCFLNPHPPPSFFFTSNHQRPLVCNVERIMKKKKTGATCSPFYCN